MKHKLGRQPLDVLFTVLAGRLTHVVRRTQGDLFKVSKNGKLKSWFRRAFPPSKGYLYKEP